MRARGSFTSTARALVHQADDLVERALNLNFGADKDGLPKPWHFCNTPASLSNNANALKGVKQSKVMKRLNATQSKASFTSKKRKVAGAMGA